MCTTKKQVTGLDVKIFTYYCSDHQQIHNRAPRTVFALQNSQMCESPSSPVTTSAWHSFRMYRSPSIPFSRQHSPCRSSFSGSRWGRRHEAKPLKSAAPVAGVSWTMYKVRTKFVREGSTLPYPPTDVRHGADPPSLSDQWVQSRCSHDHFVVVFFRPKFEFEFGSTKKPLFRPFW